MPEENAITQEKPKTADTPYPVDINIVYPERSSRRLAVCTLLFLIPKMVILVPHFIVLYVLGIVAMVLALLSQFAVLFTAKYPKGMFDIVVGVQRWHARVGAYLIGLTDKYPPFSLK